MLKITRYTTSHMNCWSLWMQSDPGSTVTRCLVTDVPGPVSVVCWVGRLVPGGRGVPATAGWRHQSSPVPSKCSPAAQRLHQWSSAHLLAGSQLCSHHSRDHNTVTSSPTSEHVSSVTTGASNQGSRRFRIHGEGLYYKSILLAERAY